MDYGMKNLRMLKQGVERFSPVFRSIRAVRTTAPVVVLTLDDGPNPDSTPEVLDTLAEYGAQATFFVLMTRARRDPWLIRRMVAEGHEVGLHGEDHRRLTTFSFSEVRRTLIEARRELQEISETPIIWFRPPYGAMTPGTWAAIKNAGMNSVLWSASALDGRDASIQDRVTHATEGIVPGDILLAHDNQAGCMDRVDDSPLKPFNRAKLIAGILERYADIGLKATTLALALDTGRPLTFMRLKR